MKRIFMLWAVMMIVFGLSVQAQATLILRGTDTLGIRLIYDDHLDITWYDLTDSTITGTGRSWGNAMFFASALTVDFGGTLFTDWRLPTAMNMDGTAPCAGSNCTGSEMGHLFYTELGNTAFFSGCTLGVDCGLTNRGPFLHIGVSRSYWSGTTVASSTGRAWAFNLANGN